MTQITTNILSNDKINSRVRKDQVAVKALITSNDIL